MFPNILNEKPPLFLLESFGLAAPPIAFEVSSSEQMEFLEEVLVNVSDKTVFSRIVSVRTGRPVTLTAQLAVELCRESVGRHTLARYEISSCFVFWLLEKRTS